MNTLSRLLDPSLGSLVVIRCLTAGTEATCFLAVSYIQKERLAPYRGPPPLHPKVLSWHLCVSLALNGWHTHCRNSSYWDGITMIGSPMLLQIHCVEELPGNLVKTKILIHQVLEWGQDSAFLMSFQMIKMTTLNIKHTWYLQQLRLNTGRLIKEPATDIQTWEAAARENPWPSRTPEFPLCLPGQAQRLGGGQPPA